MASDQGIQYDGGSHVSWVVMLQTLIPRRFHVTSDIVHDQLNIYDGSSLHGEERGQDLTGGSYFCELFICNGLRRA